MNEREKTTHVIPHEHAIQKLQAPHDHQKPHERVDELHALRRRGQVVVPCFLQDLLGGLGVRLRLLRAGF